MSSEREARTVPLVSGSSTSTTMKLPSANGNLTRCFIADLLAGFSQLYKRKHNESNLSALGDVVGESAINALVAAHYGVPIIFISGDEVTTQEAQNIAPNAEKVVVKQSLGRFG